MKKTVSLTGAFAIVVTVLAMTLASPPLGADDETPIGTMISLPGGTFRMGSPDAEKERGTDEGPRRKVTLSPYSIAACETTVLEFRAFVTATGYRTTAEVEGEAELWIPGSGWTWTKQASWKKPGFKPEEEQPVICVSLYDAVAYCNWRSESEGFEPVYAMGGTTDFMKWRKGWNVDDDTAIERNLDANGYRLPTEAEWEFAARGGKSTPFWTGMSASSDDANIGEAYDGPVTVASYPANPYGLYDTIGNVYEWVWDWYDESYPDGDETDPVGPESGDQHPKRGGCWVSEPRAARSAVRGLAESSATRNLLGFRVARNADVGR